MIPKAAVEGMRAAWITRLATMPDTTADMRAQRKLVAQFITDLGRLLSNYDDKE